MEKKRLDAISGLKVFALFSIFYWHSTLPKFGIDLGARACEFLFVVSGFLVAYNYSDRKVECSWGESIRWFFRKVIIFWPLHFIVTTFNFIVYGINWQTFLKYIIKLLFLQSWSNNQEVFFTLNGSSWFLASLLFCYFLAPFLLHFVVANKKNIAFYFVAVFLRFVIEFINKYSDLDYLNISIHVFPIVRALEFFIGMLSYPFFSNVSRYFEKHCLNKYLASFIEIFFVIISVFLMHRFDGNGLRVAFVVLFSITVIVFALNKGIISQFFSMPLFTFFGFAQFEFYIMHTTGLDCWSHIIDYLQNNCNFIMPNWCSMAIIFTITFILSYVYKRFFSNRFADVMKKIIEKVLRFFNLPISL